MSLPKWNSEWEQPDALRGRRGWAAHHYGNVVVAAGLLTMVLLVAIPVVLFPALVRHNKKEVTQEGVHEAMQDAVAAGAVGTFQKW